MKYIKNYKLFEDFEELTAEEELMGKLLHIYSPIPLSKQIASVVIKKILYPDYYKLGEDIDLTYHSPQDKVRFVDYFNSIIKYKETRGHNFEGFIAGIYNGNLSKPYEKFDVTIDNKTWSVKFVDTPSKAPEIGSFRDSLKYNNLDTKIEEEGGLTRVFRGDNINLKNNIWTNVISKGITGGWLIAYEVKNDKERYILVNMLDLDTMKNVLLNGGTAAPKGGFKAIFSLALAACSIKSKPAGNRCYRTNSKQFKIIIPQLSLGELKKMYLSNKEELWAKNVFGEFGNKIRPDVLRYVKANKEEIGKRLSNYGEYFKPESLVKKVKDQYRNKTKGS